MIPRFTTFAGPPASPFDGFSTIGMDVSEYDGATLNFWRGVIVNTGGTPKFKVNCEESTDQNTWTPCTDTTADEEVDEDEETQIHPTFSKRWFRVRIVLEGTSPVVTCWAVGFLEQRQR
jgi:hypothetical protein